MRLRNRLIALALAALAALGGVVSAAHAAGRVALIIGNSAYENLASLSNPQRDAGRMAEMLSASGFDVMSCKEGAPGCFDLDRGDMLDALEDFRDKADDADVALVFYAGHGMQTAEGNVLAPTDIEISCEDWRARRAVLLDDVLEAMEGAKEKIVILDACRNDPLKAQQCLSRGARPLSFGSIAVPASTNRFLLVTSTQNGQVAQDGPPGDHSPFAEALFHYMQAEPQSRFDQMFDLVTKRVVERTSAANFTQVPEILIRGGAPETCLSAGGCGGNAETAALRTEIAELKAANARNQEYEQIVVALLQNAGYDDLNSIPDDERQRFFDGIMAAGKALAAKGGEGEVAIAALRTGDADAAETLFERDLADAKQAAKAERKRAAESARHLAALARPSDSGKAANYFAEAAELDPGNAQSWIDVAETSLAVGEHQRAVEAYQKAVELARQGKATPEQRVWASEGFADMEWNAGRREEAAKLYREAAAAAREALVAQPFNTGLKRGLIVTHYNIGHLEMDDGLYDEALANFNAGLKIAQDLSAEYPANPIWRYDIGRAWERIGRVYQARGENDKARAAYSKKHEIMLQVRAAHPNNPEWIRDLSLADEFLGNIAWAEGDQRGALKHYEASLARMIPLRDSDPSNTDWQRFTSVTHLTVGDVLEQLGDLEAARKHFRAGMEVSEKLVAIDPMSTKWSWDLFRAYQRMASSTPPGTEWHKKALETIERMDRDGILDDGDRKWIAITKERLEASR
ncbi:MAG: caspase family protein [Rhizobiaceae bacterium]